jgi:hypothetical protein
MSVRFLPRYSFSIDIGGVPLTFVPDFFDRRDGLPGYRELPVGLSKVQRAAFRTIEVADEGVVEQATAAPGEKRRVKAR